VPADLTARNQCNKRAGLAPACDCGTVPCGFYIWNHSSTAVVNGQTFREWFINDYILNEVGRSPLVSGFFWDDVWDPGCNIHDQVKSTCQDMGFRCDHGDKDCDDPRLVQLTNDYQANMAALRNATLEAGKFAWQMLWTGGEDDGIGGTGLHPLVTKAGGALRSIIVTRATPSFVPANKMSQVSDLSLRKPHPVCHNPVSHAPYATTLWAMPHVGHTQPTSCTTHLTPFATALMLNLIFKTPYARTPRDASFYHHPHDVLFLQHPTPHVLHPHATP
jgi:hypothetical protein